MYHLTGGQTWIKKGKKIFDASLIRIKETLSFVPYKSTTFLFIFSIWNAFEKTFSIEFVSKDTLWVVTITKLVVHVVDGHDDDGYERMYTCYCCCTSVWCIHSSMEHTFQGHEMTLLLIHFVSNVCILRAFEEKYQKLDMERKVNKCLPWIMCMFKHNWFLIALRKQTIAITVVVDGHEKEICGHQFEGHLLDTDTHLIHISNCFPTFSFEGQEQERSINHGHNGHAMSRTSL